MAFVEILEVTKHQPPHSSLRGFFIDAPKANSVLAGSVVEVRGWLLPKEDPAVAVELVWQGKVFQRSALKQTRPDLAKAFPDVPWADKAGFRCQVHFAGMDEHAWGLQAVLRDQTRLPLATIRVRRRWDEGVEPGPLVSVVIPCYRQARFLGEAIESVLVQSYPNVEVVVVDDGSSDNTAAVAARYPGVRYVRQENRGLAAARNAGLGQSRGDFLVFLDSDDRLLPQAVQVGLDCLSRHPDCAIAIGFHKRIAYDGTPLPVEVQRRVEEDAYLSLLRHNVGVPSAVFYRRSVLEHIRGFDEAESPAADYDMYLRIAREFPIHSHPTPVTDYRTHGTNMTRDPGLLLRSSVNVLRKQRPHALRSEAHQDALRAGMELVRDDYGKQLVEEVWRRLEDRQWQPALRGLLTLLRCHPEGLVSRRADGDPGAGSAPPIGAVDFRDLRRVTPVSRHFGMDRGGPIDRHYIERFLAQHAGDVRGRVLEIGDDAYTRQFGGSQVTTSDVLHVFAGNPRATLVADLTRADHLPSDTYDCIILTQTLQFIYDVKLAVRALARLLKPGGVLLATVPGSISQLSDAEWHSRWCWGFTAVSARRLFEEAFPAAQVRVETQGNVLSAISFLHGLGAQELRREELEHRDGDYPVTIAVRAVKPGRAVAKAGPASEPQGAPGSAGRGALVLLYHRVAELESDPWLLGVTPAHFGEQMEVLRRHAQAIPLRQLARALGNGSLPERSVVVTFDDGYADNLLNAKPMLERFAIPATVFLVAGYLGGRREFWWDELERLLLRPGSLPGTLCLTIGDECKQWELGEARCYWEKDYQRHRRWRASESPPSARHTLYNSLYRLLHPLEDTARRRALSELAGWAAAGPDGRPTHRLLSFEEVRTLVEGGLVEAGAHTVTHPCLAALSLAGQREEILQSKARLEEVVGRPVINFAYPYGRLCDYTPGTVAIVKEAGFSCACSCFAGVVKESADPMQLPRLMVNDWDGEEFARRLSTWFDG